jgi:hypothetical protein
MESLGNIAAGRFEKKKKKKVAGFGEEMEQTAGSQ